MNIYLVEYNDPYIIVVRTDCPEEFFSQLCKIAKLNESAPTDTLLNLLEYHNYKSTILADSAEAAIHKI